MNPFKRFLYWLLRKCPNGKGCPPKLIEKVCTCGSWPDPMWTKDDYAAKGRAMLNCDKHKPGASGGGC